MVVRAIARHGPSTCLGEGRAVVHTAGRMFEFAVTKGVLSGKTQGAGAEITADKGVLEPLLHARPRVRVVSGQAQGERRQRAPQARRRRGAATCIGNNLKWKLWKLSACQL